ncbi:uncharacterized protein PHALS_08888 [Plasmopara halstedii]|uniref:Uncharacterized protein n=1 Tax=Plasmopara halstedii TaxID=4781 RepID=A0A0P1AD80_PLAHL|nr:uncharacterized protein PHALS_08888 [Plasmopara halstedii]CEG38837.1 hypothetical protein PHALS_08888 [Plasmopara halstedii]|eukprot:XP_024575206.1 hypothetical protein PHALS_08888 [Plasmopara halstedii]
MSPNSEDYAKPARFDGSDYLLRAYKMQMFLLSRGVHDVDNVKKQKAHAAIVLNLVDNQLQHVISADSAADLWMVLRRIHEG